MFMKINCRTGKRILPAYAVFPLLAAFTINCIVYYGSSFIVQTRRHYDLTLSVDRAVPVMPIFVAVYLGCYLFWIANYIIIVRQGEENCIRFITADMISRLVCGIFYVLMPTTNVRPVLPSEGVWTELLKLVYLIDEPTRLFPSIHCLVSWLCFIGIRRQKNIPRSYRLFSCLFALLVCVSTQLTKQHYIVDVFGGIALAEIAYWLAFHTAIYKYPKALFDWLYKKSFHGRRRAVRKRVNCDKQK